MSKPTVVEVFVPTNVRIEVARDGSFTCSDERVTTTDSVPVELDHVWDVGTEKWVPGDEELLLAADQQIADLLYFAKAAKPIVAELLRVVADSELTESLDGDELMDLFTRLADALPDMAATARAEAQAAFDDDPDDQSDRDEDRVRNTYTHCDQTWTDEDCDSAHNDRCPVCRAEVEPIKSEWFKPEQVSA